MTKDGEARKEKKEPKIRKKKKIDTVVVKDADKTEVFSDGDMVVRTVFEGEGDYLWDLYQHEDEWKEIDQYVEAYQKQFKEDATEKDKAIADNAGMVLLERFRPLFRKYTVLLRTGQINFRNSEQRQFVRLFVSDPALKHALNRNIDSLVLRDQITTKFNFIVEGYGHQDEEEIMDDLQVLFLTLVKRYKDVGRSFCCYVYNLYRYEVMRHIQKFQRNPENFHYKTTTLDNCQESIMDDYSSVEDVKYEDARGLPDQTWINGESCSDAFKILSKQDRLILSKYYLEEWNDRQIANLLGRHINTANGARKAAVRTFCEAAGFNPSDVVRHRKSGKKAIVDL